MDGKSKQNDYNKRKATRETLCGRKGGTAMFGKEQYREINANLNRQIEEKKVLISVHRGAWGGNIIQNTIPAFQIARDMGGDIFELDLSLSTDGVLYVFHDGTEPGNLSCDKNLNTLSSQEIDALECNNWIFEKSGVHVERFQDVLETFSHGELFNVDRAANYLPQTIELMNQYPHAIHQAIVKTAATPEALRFFEECPQKYMFMPIVRNMEEVRFALSFHTINMVGMEILAPTQKDELFQEENIRVIQEAGLFVWMNSIKLGPTEKFGLYAGLDDCMALNGQEDEAWGTMFHKGAGVIQTDWPFQLSRYRDRYFHET